MIRENRERLPKWDQPTYLEDNARISFALHKATPASFGSHIDVHLVKDRRGQYQIDVNADGGYLVASPRAANALTLTTKASW